MPLEFRPRFALPSLPRSPIKPRASPSPPSLHSGRRRLKPSSKAPNSCPPTNLRRLTSRIVDLTRRRQLRQILEEVEIAENRYGRLNTIVMNAVMEGCVHCGDVDSALRVFEQMSKPEGCGVDAITYGILLKGLGEARRIDEAFEMLESLEHGTALGNPKLSPQLIFGLLNALLEAGDMRRASGLIARYRLVLHEEGHSVLMLFNLLMKGYIHTGFPLGALAVRDEILRQGLKPDKLTYNTLIFAYVKSGKMEDAIQTLEEMKVSSKHFKDVVTYTTLLKGLVQSKDLRSVQKIVLEMKSSCGPSIDRTAYTAIIDTLLAYGSIMDALCIFGEIIKKTGENNNLKPKPHLYLSLMRAFAVRGDFCMVKILHRRMWLDSSGSISPSVKEEADELLMEAALNNDKIDVARQILSSIIIRRGEFSWTGRGGMVAMRLEALSGFTSSMFSPYILPQVLFDDPIEKYMIAFEEANPLPANLELKNICFLMDSAVPVIDEWGSCVGIVHRDDCNKLDAPLSTVMRGPPPYVTSSTSIGRVIEILLEKRHEMVVIVRSNNAYDSSYGSSSRPVGVFTREKLFQLVVASSEAQEYSCKILT